MKRYGWMYCLAILALAPSAAWAQVRYTVTDLTEIWNATFSQPETIRGWFPSAINNRGQVVGEAATVDNSHFAFLWDQVDGLRDFRDLGEWSSSYGVNDAGQIVVESEPGAYLWSPDNSLQPIQGYGSDSIGLYAVNESAQVAGAYWAESGNAHAFLWEDGVMQDLGNLGGEYTTARELNKRGQVVGSSHVSGDMTEHHAFVWDSVNGMQDLGTAGLNSVATGINDGGQIVGHSATETHPFHATFWEDGCMTDISPSYVESSYGMAINDLGQIVGTAYLPIGEDVFPFVPFLWDRSLGFQDLNSLLPPDSPWRICEAKDINDNGWIIASAVGHDVEGYQLLLKPIPEPSSLILLLAAGLTTAALIFSSLRKGK